MSARSSLQYTEIGTRPFLPNRAVGLSSVNVVEIGPSWPKGSVLRRPAHYRRSGSLTALDGI